MACAKAHDEVDLLYEKLFSDQGTPIEDQEKIVSLLQATSQRMRLELEIIKSSLQEYHETGKIHQGGV